MAAFRTTFEADVYTVHDFTIGWGVRTECAEQFIGLLFVTRRDFKLEVLVVKAAAVLAVGSELLHRYRRQLLLQHTTSSDRIERTYSAAKTARLTLNPFCILS